LKLKHIIHSQAYGAMVSWTHLVQKTLDSNGLIDHPTSLYRGKNADDNSLTRQEKKKEKKKTKLICYNKKQRNHLRFLITSQFDVIKRS
jgi:hypothetical protein